MSTYTKPWAESTIASIDNGQWVDAQNALVKGVKHRPFELAARCIELTGLLHERRGEAGLDDAAKLMRQLRDRKPAPPAPPVKTLTCDMTHGCGGTVTHIDNKGWTYCTYHGEQRRSTRPCRKLRSGEIAKLQHGQPKSY